jgi:hypothetical protein
MDLEIQNQIEKLKGFGLDDTKITALIHLAFEDFIDEMEDDLGEVNSEELKMLDEELQAINKETLSEQDASNLLKDILRKIYGIQAEGHWNKYLLTYLQECVQEAGEAKDFFTKVQNDDPEALKQIIAAQQSPDYDAAKAAIEEVSKLDE